MAATSFASSLPEMQALRDKYRAQGVELLMINSNLADSRDAIEKEAKAQGIDLPILLDETQIIGESLGLKRNGELLVINTKGWKVAYRGPVSAGGTPYAANALDAVINATPVEDRTGRCQQGQRLRPEIPRSRSQAGAREDLL